MLTSQKFLGMTVMMLVLFFIVQFPQIMKEAGNEYDVNEYAVDPGENASDEWKDTGGADADRRRFPVPLRRGRGDPVQAVGVGTGAGDRAGGGAVFLHPPSQDDDPPGDDAYRAGHRRPHPAPGAGY